MKVEMNMRNFIIIVILLISTAASAQNSAPDWTIGAVWYHIFPERFRNLNPRNDPSKPLVTNGSIDWQVHPWASDWYKLQIWEAERKVNFYELVAERRFGGDLFGVLEKLPYLKDLGVDVICFSPLFESPSPHKYDASTFHHIDNNFGAVAREDLVKLKHENNDSANWEFSKADDRFFELIRDANKLGIKIVLEAVFNYCSREFWAFKDLREKQQASKFKDWFEVTAWDDPATPDTVEFAYNCWRGDKNRPTFKKDENGRLSKPVEEYIFKITKRWMVRTIKKKQSGVDGWLVKHAGEIAPAFWEAWVQLVKKLNPAAAVIGDFWKQKPEWINSKRFDTITNYPFAYILRDFFISRNGMSVAEFDQKLADLRSVYPEESNRLLLNLVDGFAMPRVASLIKNPHVSLSQDQNTNHAQYDPRKPDKDERQIQKLLTIFQMTYIGAPVIFYGDESGMWGGAYPDNLKPMLWKELVYEYESYEVLVPELKETSANVFDSELFNLYKKLIKIRHEHPAIRKGAFETRMIDDEKKIYAFSRKDYTNEVLVFLNNSDDRQAINFKPPWEITKKTKMKDLLTDAMLAIDEGMIKLDLAAKSGAILVKEK